MILWKHFRACTPLLLREQRSWISPSFFTRFCFYTSIWTYTGGKNLGNFTTSTFPKRWKIFISNKSNWKTRKSVGNVTNRLLSAGKREEMRRDVDAETALILLCDLFSCWKWICHFFLAAFVWAVNRDRNKRWRELDDASKLKRLIQICDVLIYQLSRCHTTFVFFKWNHLFDRSH